MKKIVCGNEKDKMPNIAFRIMAMMFRIVDVFKPKHHYIDEFGIEQGFAVADYGCGPGRHIRRASELVGSTGIVYAIDIHKLAVSSINKLIRKYSLTNVKALQTDGNTVGIESNTFDLIYALDMFHMVSDTDSFLKELNRIAKPGGILILEDGHQPRELSKEKIIKSGCWEIVEESKKHMKCSAIK